MRCVILGLAMRGHLCQIVAKAVCPYAVLREQQGDRQEQPKQG